MAKTALELTAEEWRHYQPDKNCNQAQAIARWEQAWKLVPQLSNLLRDQFGATKVVVFGSLVHRERYTPWSDIDLAAWGIPPERFYEAVFALSEISPDFKVDLADPEHCRPSVQKAIENKGVAV